jgi:hypothetical protein
MLSNWQQFVTERKAWVLTHYTMIVWAKEGED